jgi:hypothetical protein
MQFVLAGLVKTLNKTYFTDEWLDKIFEVQIYIGCSGWVASGQGFLMLN